MFENQPEHLKRKKPHKSLNQFDLGVLKVRVFLCVSLLCPLTVLPQAHHPLLQFGLQPLSCHPAHRAINKKWMISKMHEKCLWRGREIKKQTRPLDK